ncbi:MAG: hypothetical protein ACFFCS_00215 [Candidatus Hodarchaeota archaeon]
MLIPSSGDIEGSYSNNPSSPQSLSDDVGDNELFPASDNYYYSTFSATAGQPHLISLNTMVIPGGGNSYMYLYSDSTYSLAYTWDICYETGQAFIVYTPSTTGSMYFMVYTPGTSNCYVEAQSSTLASTSTDWDKWLPFTLSDENNYEIWRSFLTGGMEYRLELIVPSSSDWNLYAGALASGGYTANPDFSSTSSTLGQDEVITFTASATQYYYMIAERVSGDSSSNFRISRVRPLSEGVTDTYTWLDEMVDPLYYKTGTASSNDYHLIWSTYTGTSPTNYLELCDDPDWTNVIEDPPNVNGGITEWTVYSPSSSGAIYPRLISSNFHGDVYVGWESSIAMSIGDYHSRSYNQTSAGEVYEIYVSSSAEYKVSLDVDPGLDANLYLFRKPAGTTTMVNYLSSENVGIGADEEIYFTPTGSTYYAFVVIWVSGSGNAIFELERYHSPLPDGSSSYLTMGIPAGIGQYYFYQTYSMSSSDYHLITAASDDNPTYLFRVYMDSGYNTLGSNPGGSGTIRWTAYNPATSTVVYPLVNSQGSTGTGYVEAQSAMDIALGSSYGATLSLSNAGEIWEIDLLNRKTYWVNLTVAGGCNFDLYVFRLSSGSFTLTDLHASTSSTLGVDESIRFSPDSDAKYGIVALRRAGSGTATIQVALDNYAPTLTSGDVSPLTGTTSTSFNYSVTYTDADNDAPASIQVYIDGSPQTMSKLISGDNDYTDGCVYQYLTTLAEGSHNYYFSTSDGIDTDRLPIAGSYSGPDVNYIPTLTSANVTPSNGTTSDSYLYSVIYTDLDNNTPSIIQVIIDGTPWNMTKQNLADNNYMDGCVYQYTTTLSEGSHNYYFSTSDGIDSASTSTSPNPTVNYIPTLTTGGVSQPTGTIYTNFSYTVVYTDQNNEAPSYIRVFIDGMQYTMNKSNPGDLDYTDGCTYEYNTTLSSGVHNYYFTASDGRDTARLPISSNYTGPDVNYIPTLTMGGVTPSLGTTYTTFTYSVNYTDADNEAPTTIQVFINSTPYDLDKHNISDNNFIDGCIFEKNLSIGVGVHTFYFFASDGLYDVRDPVSGEKNQSAVLDASGDEDGDGLNNTQEVDGFGTDPFNPDTDSDGWTDKAEIDKHTDPLDPSSYPEESNFWSDLVKSGLIIPIVGAIVSAVAGFAIKKVKDAAKKKKGRKSTDAIKNG